MRIAVQMDPIERVNIETDSSFSMIEEAQAREYPVWVYGTDTLTYQDGQITARARPASVRRIKGDHVTLGEPVRLDLRRDVDVVLMRQDPPFDMAYLTAAHLLEMLAPDTLVVNDPAWVRSSPEKIFPLLFAELMPPTLISRDPEAIGAFRDTFKDIIIKPLFGNGGAGVFHVPPTDGNYRVILETFFATSREPVMAQAFMPQVSEGDKRIILVDGEVAGGFNRRPAKGEARSNMAAGGKAEATELSPADLAICAAIGPELKRRGQIFVGIDVIAGKLTEINVTSPTGANALKAFTGVDSVALMWNAIETRLRAG